MTDAVAGWLTPAPAPAPTPTPAPTPVWVFISYSAHDETWAEDLRQFLDGNGFRAWMAPHSLSGSTPWPDQILVALAACPITVVVLSEHANASPHVPREVSIALDAGKSVVPVRIEPVELSGALQYLLHLVQWVDVFPAPVERHRDALLTRLAAAQPSAAVPIADWSAPAPAPIPAERGDGGGRRRSWLLPVVAAAVVALLVVAGVAFVRSRDSGGSTGSGGRTDVLARIPSSLDTMADLQPYIAEVIASYPMPSGSALTLVPHQDKAGSIAFRSPSTWTSVNAAAYHTDATGAIGSELDSEVDNSRFYKYTVGGIYIGATLPGAQLADTVDGVWGSAAFVKQGCLSSPVVAIGSPMAGQVRVWGGCTDGRIFVVGYLADSKATEAFFTLATTEAEARVLTDMLVSIALTPSQIPARASASPSVTS